VVAQGLVVLVEEVMVVVLSLALVLQEQLTQEAEAVEAGLLGLSMVQALVVMVAQA
jgi:hypothetical protein